MAYSGVGIIGGSTGKKVRSTEWDVIHMPVTKTTRRLCIFCHGRASTALDFVDSAIGDRNIANYGVPFIAQDNGGEYSYGNESAIASIDEQWTYMINTYGVASDKLLFYFGSMGNFPTWNWIRRNPGKTAAVVCGLPVIQFDYLHDTLGSPYNTEIETAHGTWAAAQALDPLAHVADIKTGLAGAPVQFWYPTDDSLQPVQGSIDFADGLNIPAANRYNMNTIAGGAVGHSMSYVNRETVAKFLARYSVV